MPEAGPEWASKIEDLSRRLEQVERRLERLEARSLSGEEQAVPTGPSAEGEAATPSVRQRLATTMLTLTGRTLVVLAGAFLLRAFTEGGILPQGLGTLLGVIYALVWILLADRAVARQDRIGATFHGLAAAIIAFPLLFEATVRFGFLSPPSSVASLALITAAALLVGLRRAFRRLVWVFALAASATALALAVATKFLLLFASFLLILGLATLWIGTRKGWRGPGWWVAGVLDVSVLLMTLLVLSGRQDAVEQILHPSGLVALQLSMVALYLGSFAARTLTEKTEARLGEAVQSIAALLVGLGGAILVTREANLTALPLGLVALVGSIACYGVGFGIIDRRKGPRTNFIGYTSVALLFALVAVFALLTGAALAAVLAGLAVGAAWLGDREGRLTLSLHGAAYAVGATIGGGVVRSAWRALVEPGFDDRSWITLPVLLVIAAVATCVLLDIATHGRTWGEVARPLKVLLWAILLLALDGLVISLIGPALPRGEEGGVDPGNLAALRTGVLALNAVVVAVLGRWTRFGEAIWLVYPFLVVGGIKLVAVDLRAGRASTLVVSLGLFGAALILAARLTRRDGGPVRGAG